MKRSYALDKKIIELQKAVESLKNNRDDLIKELENVKSRVSQKRTV